MALENLQCELLKQIRNSLNVLELNTSRIEDFSCENKHTLDNIEMYLARGNQLLIDILEELKRAKTLKGKNE